MNFLTNTAAEVCQKGMQFFYNVLAIDRYFFVVVVIYLRKLHVFGTIKQIDIVDPNGQYRV